MKHFMDQNFLLTTPTAEKLYHGVAASLPIVDYHCHVSPKEIFEDRRFDNLTQVWLGGDHYKWRLMRSNGIEERYITGDASDREKFFKFAETLPKAIGNPMYHWCHLELQRYFGYTGILNADTAEEVWERTKEALRDPEMSVRGLIRQSNAVFIGTTDDPTDSLEWHDRIAADKTFDTLVAPSFRPDKALNVQKPEWKEYIGTLSQVSGISVDGLDTLKQALSLRMDYFNERGCRASDHGLDRAVFRPAEPNEADAVVRKALHGGTVTTEEAEVLKTELLLFCAERYTKLGWVMQIHYNCIRNPNSEALRTLGPDSGFDIIGPNNGAAALTRLLDTLHTRNTLPRTVLYSLDAGDNAFLDSLIGAFQNSGIPGSLQHGSAWWFNDHKQGMREHLTGLANLSLLGNFVGMLTDSRSFLSYTRHEYFRRILCGLIGEWVESGEYPDGEAQLEQIVRDVCYRNAARYFRLNEEDTPCK